MKKHWISEKYKKYNLRHSRKLSKRRLGFKDYRNKKNSIYNHMNQQEREEYIENKQNRKIYDFVQAPTDFSFSNNTEEMISFVNKLSSNFESRKKTMVDMEKVEFIAYNSLIVLLSVMVNFKSHKIDFNGNFPKDYKAKKLLIKSGFFENLYFGFSLEDRYNIEGKNNGIHTHAWKDVDSKLGQSIIADASRTVWGIRRRCPGIQRTIIELMLNTNNHANPSIEGEKHWWLSVNHIKEENKVCFSFIDYGVGVFNSLQKKSAKSKWFDWPSKLKKTFSYETNSDLLKLILNGSLHRTVTNQHYRGKGLPGIKEAYSRGDISNLKIITNDVYADVANDKYKSLSKNFNGTFIYWELVPENRSFEWKQKK